MMKQFSKTLVLMLMCAVIPLKAWAAGGDEDLELFGDQVMNLLNYSTVSDKLDRLSSRVNGGNANLSQGLYEINHAQDILRRNFMDPQTEPEEIGRHIERFVNANFKGLHILNRELLLQPVLGETRMSFQAFRDDLRGLGFLTCLESLDHDYSKKAVTQLVGYVDIVSRLMISAELDSSQSNSYRSIIRSQIMAIGQSQQRLRQAIPSGDEEEVTAALYEILAENFRGLRMLNILSGSYTRPMSDQEFVNALQRFGIFTTLEMLESLLEGNPLPFN